MYFLVLLEDGIGANIGSYEKGEGLLLFSLENNVWAYWELSCQFPIPRSSLSCFYHTLASTIQQNFYWWWKYSVSILSQYGSHQPCVAIEQLTCRNWRVELVIKSKQPPMWLLLDSCHSKCTPQTSTCSIALELVRNADSQVPPQTYWNRSRILADSPWFICSLPFSKAGLKGILTQTRWLDEMGVPDP